MSAPKTAAEMESIRAANSVLREKEMAEFQPEPIEYKDGLFLVVSRCVKGPFLGMFMLTQITLDDHGKPLKKPIRKTLIEGTDRDGINRAIDKAMGARFFR